MADRPHDRPAPARLPATGRDAGDVLAAMDAGRTGDLDWRSGRIFSLVYSAGDDVLDLLGRAAGRFPAENALNTMVFPSLGRMQREIIEITAGLLGADDVSTSGTADAAGPAGTAGTTGVRGYLTSGGTESLLQAVRTARDHARATRSVTRANLVVATSAHAAFDKAGHWFDVECRRIPVDVDGAADPDAMADAVDADTVLVVGSAPSYPQGVIDPIPALAALAAERGVPCHVDACLGGFLLPFLDRLGRNDRPWDLSVPGVTSVSADLHKYGYASKGVSVIVYRTKELADRQPFVTSAWLGGRYGSPAMAGTRPAGPIAAGWAVLHHLGEDGYLRLADRAARTADRILAHVRATPGLSVRGRPDATVFAFGGDPAAPAGGRIDTFALGDALAARRGWYFDRQEPPESLHATVHAGHAEVVDELLADLTGAAADLAGSGRRADDRSTTYGTA